MNDTKEEGRLLRHLWYSHATRCFEKALSKVIPPMSTVAVTRDPRFQVLRNMVTGYIALGADPKNPTLTMIERLEAMAARMVGDVFKDHPGSGPYILVVLGSWENTLVLEDGEVFRPDKGNCAVFQLFYRVFTAEALHGDH